MVEEGADGGVGGGNEADEATWWMVSVLVPWIIEEYNVKEE